MPKKVCYCRPLNPSELVEFCPFCGEAIHGSHHDCSQFPCPRDQQIRAKVTYCPLCGNQIDKAGHECP